MNKYYVFAWTQNATNRFDKAQRMIENECNIA